MRAILTLAAFVCLCAHGTSGFLFAPDSVYQYQRNYYEIMTQCEQEGGECVDVDLGPSPTDPPATPGPPEAPDSTDPPTPAPTPAPLPPNQPLYNVLPPVDPYVNFVPVNLPQLPPKTTTTTTTTSAPLPYFPRVPQNNARFMPQYVPPVFNKPAPSMFRNAPLLPLPNQRASVLQNRALPPFPNPAPMPPNPRPPMFPNPAPPAFRNPSPPKSSNYLPKQAATVYPRPSPKFAPIFKMAPPPPPVVTPAPSPIRIIPDSVLNGVPDVNAPLPPANNAPLPPANYAPLPPNFVPLPPMGAPPQNKLYFPKPAGLPGTTTTAATRVMYVERELPESRQRRAVSNLDSLYGECAGGWEFDLGCSNKGKNVCCYPANARRRRR